jgi:hypothetical protein
MVARYKYMFNAVIEFLSLPQEVLLQKIKHDIFIPILN